jgi:hypothetical protein
MLITTGHLRRGALWACAIVAAIACMAPAAANASTAGTEAATWLATQLKTPTGKPTQKYCEQFGSPSVGQTIECQLALKAAGSTFNTKRGEAYEWIVANKAEYVGTKACEESPEKLSAGAVAKLAISAEAQGKSPKEVGGRNLIEDLKCLQVKTGTEKGRFKDRGKTDFSNTFGQSLAIIALRECELHCTGKPSLKTTIEPAAEYLIAQQCVENKAEKVAGAYRSAMGNPNTACNNEPPYIPEKELEEPNAVEVDSTGAAVQALVVSNTAGAPAAAEKAIEWLKGKQEATSGYWKNYCSEKEPTKAFASVNSTALAIMAGIADKKPFEKAQVWLEGIVTKQPAGEKGLPACTETGEANVLATSQSIFGLEGTTYPVLAE